MPISALIPTLANRARNLQDVHFHRGPQGQPVPCYDTPCQLPPMASEDVREAALHTASPG